MITFYFDQNARTLVQSPGNLAPASPQTWVYGDNYNLAVYIVAGGQFLPISPSDTLTAILYQPPLNVPEQQLAIMGTPTQATDANGNRYFSININLATTQLAALVQATNQPVVCQFHFVFNPADAERFSESQDVQTTVNPDPTQGAAGGTPVPPGYPSNSNVFQLISGKGAASGYAGLDATGKVPAAQLPTSTVGGDMLKSVYDTNNNGIVDTCDSIVSSRVSGLGTAAIANVPASGNATAAQVVLGNDTRLADSRAPVAHQGTHNGGSDPIPLASSSAQGLCPPVDGTTIQVVSGKLTAATTGTGDMLKSVFVTGSATNANTIDNALAVQTHQVPAAGNASGSQLVIATDTRLADARQPQVHAATHLTAGSDPIALATLSVAGLCPSPDGTTLTISGGKLAAILATAAAPGIVKPDGTSITIAAGVISAAGGIGAHGARVHNAAQTNSIPSGSLTKINWDTAEFDTDGYHSGASFTNLVVPAPQAGYYIVCAQIQWPNTTGGTYRGIYIGKVAVGMIAYSYLPYNSGYPQMIMVASGITQLSASDTVYLYVIHDVGSAVAIVANANSWLSLFRIG